MVIISPFQNKTITDHNLLQVNHGIKMGELHPIPLGVTPSSTLYYSRYKIVCRTKLF
jgi:hypothetical protein